jgi:excisionase family DNA binding protein
VQVAAPAYLTPPQVARMLSVKASKVGRWIRTGELPAVDVSERRGGRPRWKISRESFDAFMAARSSRPPVPHARRRRRAAQPEVTPYF